MVEDKKESKINIEEFLLQQLNWSLEMKSRLEMKATAYVAIVTLMMTLLSSMKILPCTSKTEVIFIFAVIVFFIGLLIIVICAVILFPKKMYTLDSKWLLAVYHDKDNISDDELNNRFVNMIAEYTTRNKSMLIITSICNKIVSLLVMAEVVSFVITCIMYFFTRS